MPMRNLLACMVVFDFDILLFCMPAKQRVVGVSFKSLKECVNGLNPSFGVSRSALG